MKTVRLATLLASVISWISFAATIFATFMADKYYMIPFVREAFDNDMPLKMILFGCVMTIAYVVIAVTIDTVTAVIQLLISSVILSFDEDIRREVQIEGVKYRDISLNSFKQNTKDTLMESLARLLMFWNEFPIAIITHLVCGFLIIKLGW